MTTIHALAAELDTDTATLEAVIEGDTSGTTYWNDDDTLTTEGAETLRAQWAATTDIHAEEADEAEHRRIEADLPRALHRLAHAAAASVAADKAADDARAHRDDLVREALADRWRYRELEEATGLSRATLDRIRRNG